MSDLARKLRQWRALQPWEQRLLIRMVFLLPAAKLLLLLLGFKRTRRIAECELPSASGVLDQATMARAQRQAQLTAIAARHGFYKANCLPQSLALCRVLRKQGLPAQIRIGVQVNAQPFQAHAWVELDGVPLGQSVDAYKAFDRLSADPETMTFS